MKTAGPYTPFIGQTLDEGRELLNKLVADASSEAMPYEQAPGETAMGCETGSEFFGRLLPAHRSFTEQGLVSTRDRYGESKACIVQPDRLP